MSGGTCASGRDTPRRKAHGLAVATAALLLSLAPTTHGEVSMEPADWSVGPNIRGQTLIRGISGAHLLIAIENRGPNRVWVDLDGSVGNRYVEIPANSTRVVHTDSNKAVILQAAEGGLEANGTWYLVYFQPK